MMSYVRGTDVMLLVTFTFQDSQHEAHSIKGAAANLMCNRVRTAALYLEKAGRAGNKLPKGAQG